MAERNRSEGWVHAKRSGHINEQLVAELTMRDKSVQQRILSCAHLEGETILDVQYGGLCERDVDCILDGGKTKSKTDMWLRLSNGQRLNVSIKKDRSGQVFLIGIDRFLRGFQQQYNKLIPENVKRALALYFGSAEDVATIANTFGSNQLRLELRKHRLVADTLRAYDNTLYDALLDWFNENISELFDFCFSKGLASQEEDWAQIVWYINLLGERNLDTLIYLPDLRASIPQACQYGPRNGGSTIQLPFGFLQWHSPRKTIPGNLQFHHIYEKMLELQ